MFTLAVVAAIATLAFLGLRHPALGVLGWTWISLMNPHALTWRLADAPVAAIMAVSTLIGLLATSDRRNFRFSPEMVVLSMFMAWMCITLPFSMRFDPSFALWNRVMKIDLMILVALFVLYSRQHIVALAWVMVGSVGIYGVKGGLFTLATGGTYRVWGPDGTYIYGNNEVALALVMVIPLMRFLQMTSDKLWVRRGLVASMVLCAVAAIGSQSRGALLAITAMALVMWWRGPHRARAGLVMLALGVLVIIFMPDSWTERMSTIKTYDQDDSANQRLNAWMMAWNIAKDRLFGAGFMVSVPEVCAVYSPIPTDCRAAHSIYFMVLGEHGFIGLILFLVFWFLVWRSAGKLRVEAARQAETAWLAPLGAMAQVSLAGYAVGGAFLSLSYYDLPYNIMVLVVLARRWMARKAWMEEAAEAADPATVGKRKTLFGLRIG
ncbi:putative O-glycosylation ligase, exosortase A system-associated [Pelomonas sp. SE-A7]|uniref:putative O-glycosylation ligase, exosortase A system-associated n=1 Tax=Pelomonas sp. SE-A7 TaxID=3054953 RepID=UPI00259C6E01|nr:putative O-glycosylation ligase, exosortase A system-associated [Pelomonas sp. SE-A7]MDM4764883.1 putative O-glycosylation ligase, exosortase A system-associated [Pelomonas sp. SE-A7]